MQVFDWLLVVDKVEQKKREEKNWDTHEYGTLTLESYGRDCDGPMTSKTLSYYVTEQESIFMLADHFGFGGWTLTVDGKESFFTQHVKTDEGYWTRDAHLYFPDQDENE